jgi:hypothetical protein
MGNSSVGTGDRQAAMPESFLANVGNHCGRPDRSGSMTVLADLETADYCYRCRLVISYSPFDPAGFSRSLRILLADNCLPPYCNN